VDLPTYLSSVQWVTVLLYLQGEMSVYSLVTLYSKTYSAGTVRR